MVQRSVYEYSHLGVLGFASWLCVLGQMAHQLLAPNTDTHTHTHTAPLLNHRVEEGALHKYQCAFAFLTGQTLPHSHPIPTPAGFLKTHPPAILAETKKRNLRWGSCSLYIWSLSPQNWRLLNYYSMRASKNVLLKQLVLGTNIKTHSLSSHMICIIPKLFPTEISWRKCFVGGSSAIGFPSVPFTNLFQWHWG